MTNENFQQGTENKTRSLEQEGSLPLDMNRREWLKYFGAGGLASGLASSAGCIGITSSYDNATGGGSDEGDGGNKQYQQLPFPLDQPNKWNDITLNWTTDSSAGPVYDMFGPLINEETGIEFVGGEILPSGQYYSKLNIQLISGDSPYDIILMIPLYLGDFQSRGVFEPLDDYIDRYDGLRENYFDNIIEPYKKFYMKYRGNIVALPIDGDIHNLFYRPSFFTDQYHKEQYKREYGSKLRVPQTWPEYNQIAKYFTENTDDGIYGCQVFGARPWNFGWWMDRAASRGVIYFNREMEPQINSPDAIKALKHMVESAKYAPPGTSQFGIAATSNRWQQGKVVMNPWWIDLSEFSARGDFPVVGDQSAAPMPGWKQSDGSIRRNAMMLYNRLYSIPASIPERKKQAAFYAIARLSESRVSKYAVADPYTGMDPFLDPHYTKEAARLYTQPTPIRGVGEGFPRNVPVFPPDREYPHGRNAYEHALQHIRAGQENMKRGFPQPTWPGASRYTETLSIHIQRAISGDESPKEALDATAEEWRSIVDSLGREAQQQAYRRFYDKAVELGYV